jgi:ankyrin repeat protein
LEKIQEILESEDVNITDESNHTILHVASYHGNEHLVEYLLDQGAQTDAQNNDGRIPLHLASQRGHVNVMKLLLNRGRTKTEDNWGLTPLHRAAYKGQKEAVQVLLEAGFDPNSRNNHHSTPLHSAARGGHNDVIDLLIEKNADIKAVNIYKKTCLHEAATKGCTDTVRHLVKLYKDIVDAVDKEGQTALHLSAEKNYFTIVQALVEAKANISLTDNYRKTALDVATENKRKEIVEYLQKHSQFTI